MLFARILFLAKKYMKESTLIEPLFFDTDCICAFLWVNEQTLLPALYPGRLILPKPVYTEISKVVHLKTAVDTMISKKQLIPQRSESSKSIPMVPLPSECRESKVRYPAPWGGKGGNASSFQGLP